MEKSWKLEDLNDCLVWTQDLTPRIIIIIITSNLNILYSKEVKENEKFRDKNKKIRI